MNSEYVTVKRDGKYYELWVGFDLDGTLLLDEGWNGCNPDKFGYIMTNTFVYKLLLTAYKMGQQKNEQGKKLFKVKLFTARACEEEHAKLVRQWVRKYSLTLPDMEVTATKDYGCRAIIDDRAVPVWKNKGVIACSKEYLKGVFDFI